MLFNAGSNIGACTTSTAPASRVRQNDRYEKKMKLYGEETKRHLDTLEGNGFPIVLNPLSAPAAYYEQGCRNMERIR